MRHATGIALRTGRDTTWEAFEARADASSRECLRLAAAIVGPDDAADVVQDALLRAWRSITSLKDPDAFDPWVRSIVINQCRNVLRTRSRRPRVVALDVAGLRPTDASTGPDARVEVRDRLERAFAGLDVHHRAVLALRFTLDLSMRDIAQTLGVPEGTARSRLNAAVTRLRAALHEEDR